MWELAPHTPEYLSITQIPVEYKPEAVCREIINFLRDILSHKDIGTIFRLIGYCLLPDCRYIPVYVESTLSCSFFCAVRCMWLLWLATIVIRGIGR
jgi:hypothetical protein